MEMTTRLAERLALRSPVLAAAGTFGYGIEAADLADCGQFGALITPTMTLAQRSGNPMPRTVEATAGLLHSLGLPNPGLEAFVREYIPRLRALSCPVIVSLCAETTEEWERLAGELDATGVPVALELNLTPLSLALVEHAHESPLPEAEQLKRLEAAVRAARGATRLPLLAKLPAVGVEIGAAAQAAQREGADVISVSQAFPGVAVRLSSRKFRLPGVVGGLSGPCIKPLALYQVWRAAQSTDLPIVGSGGIMTSDDALEFLMAGATAVAVGVASTIHPAVISRITAEMSDYLQSNGLSGPGALVGAANR